MKRLNGLLDRYVLPCPVRFLTVCFVILATILLLGRLLFYANNQVPAPDSNSYLHTMRVAVSSIVLLFATIAVVQQERSPGCRRSAPKKTTST